MSPQVIYGCADVATLLRVTRAAISNYRSRHEDTVPAADYVTPDGRPFWTEAAMTAWLIWDIERKKKPMPGGNISAAEAIVNDLRSRLSEKLKGI